jgi:hypothetical protein
MLQTYTHTHTYQPSQVVGSYISEELFIYIRPKRIYSPTRRFAQGHTSTRAHTQVIHTYIHAHIQVCNFTKDGPPADVVMCALEARRNKAHDAQLGLEGLLGLLAPTQDLALRRAVLRKLAHADVCTHIHMYMQT